MANGSLWKFVQARMPKNATDGGYSRIALVVW
jgi:hypothetical protein